MKERIAKFIREKAYKPMTFEELSVAMGVAEKQHVQLRKTLEQMEAAGEVVQTRLQRYGAPERMNLAVGRLQGHPKGFGFLVQDDPEAEDIFVGRESLNGAWHGDRVIVRLSPPARAGGRVEGEVIRILHRATTRVVGTFEAAKHAGYVTPDDQRLADDIFIPRGATNGAKSGEKVVVQIVTYPEARRNAEGKIVERLGMKGAVGVDIVSVIRKFGLPEVFPPRVLAEAEPIPETVTEDAVREPGRRDLRGWTIVTIDGEDAKDLDDAVNVERIGNGHWRLGVHIADVSYYVAEGSQLDREAYTRATSVYLADRVVPMLPPKLSNGICSLNPHVDRLTLSCVMELDAHGKVLKYEIFPSVIKTAARMTYTRVNEILAGDEAALAEYRNLVPMFREMHALQQVLRERRMRRGALDFDLPEAKVKLNESGWPIEIRRVNRGIAERIIEEFMLVANETVAEHCHRQAVPFMYRVHGEPAGDRLAGLRDFLGLFGYSLKLPGDGSVPAKLLQSITDWVRGRPEENLINQVLLRTMRQAVYSAENFGHFGLAADYYCHFTSPIRRYPDLVVHRVLRALMSGAMNPKLKSKWERWIPDAAQHSSDRERVAMEAERETIDLKKAEWMSERIGETFEGQISGVGTFGFFVQLPNTVEGLVHISALTDDYYHFHDNYYALIGERTRRRFRLGDPVKVRVERVDVDNRQVDFSLDAAESPVVTVAAVPGETRQRSDRKRALMGLEPKQPEQQQQQQRQAGRGRQARPEPRQEQRQELPREDEGARKGGKRRRKGKRGNEQAAEAGLAIAVAPAPVPRPVAKLKAQPPVEQERPRTRQHRKEHEPVRVRPGSRVDMWGVPVPEGRFRKPIEDDPSVTNPYALTPAPRDGGGGRSGGGNKAFTEAPFAPAPGTADESAGLPGVVDGGGKRRSRPVRRRPRARNEEE
ncbi:MAG TPA: ribonuclease R [Symbiobacteriaceae bacterium]|nr:ribonuclease R [Symbiobacteriaceae bacterium]